MSYKNVVAKLLVIVAIVLAILTFIAGFINGSASSNIGMSNSFEWSTALSTWFIGFVTSLLFWAIAEIIEKLNRLNSRFDPNEVTSAAEFSYQSNFNKTTPTSELGSDQTENDKPKPTFKDYQGAWALTIGGLILLFIFIFVALAQN